MKKKIKIVLSTTLTACLTLSLQGCGGGGNEKQKAPPVTGAAAFVAGTHPRFDPVTSDIPFNTDLIFAAAATSDGTANVGDPTDGVRATLNVLDGFSTSAYFDVMIDGSVDPATVLPLKTVFLIQLDTGGKDALNPANVVGIVGPASFDTKVMSLDGGTNNVVRILPKLPLKSKAKYLVVLTNDIKDAAGKPLTRSWTYNALHDTTYAVTDSLLPVRTAITGWEKLAAGFLTAVNTNLTASAAIDKLVLTYTFTTTDPQAPLIAMAAPRAAIAGLQIAAGVAPSTAVTNVVGLDNAGLLPTPKKRQLGISPFTGIDLGVLTNGALPGNVGKLYTGYIKLPYYQTVPGTLPFGAFLTRNWTPDRTLAAALGVTVPADVDGSFNVTYRYPFAAKTTDESVPLQVTLPEKNWVPGYAGSLSCAQIYALSGYPVAIYVHGITSDRSSAVILAHTLAGQCIATVAIDLPLHGVAANNSNYVNVLNVEKSQLIDFAKLYGDNAPHERHFNVAGPGGAPAPMNFATPGSSDGSGAQFTNLGYMANTRDNNRESVIDLLNLNASLKGINENFLQDLGVSLNLGNVYVVGVSLGGILSTVFTSVNQAAIASDAAIGLPSNLNPIHGLVAASAGTQVSQVLINSPSFAPVINAGLAAKGVNVGTSNYEKFIYSAQSALDSGDPVSFAQLLATQKVDVTNPASVNVPVLVQQINGDVVVPNGADGAPLMGTRALARLLGAEILAPGEKQLGLGYVRVTAGDHVSLLRPTDAAPQITHELQAEVVTFILNSGKVTVGSQAAANIQGP